MNTTLIPLFRAVRRRLRVAWALTTLQLVAPLVALGALGLVLAGRFFDLSWAEPSALVLVASVVALVTGYALVCRVPDLLVARAADRGLRTRDAFATSLELADHHDDFADRVRHRAQELADVATPKEAVRYRLLRKPTGIAALIAPAALVLAFIANPQDALRERRADDRAAIEATADVLRAEAERIAELPGGQDAADRLAQLADELSKTDSLEKADDLLQEAAAELGEQTGPDTLAKTAATEGLQRSLENSPLPGASSEQSVQDQLEALAGELPGMSDSELADAAERLDALAATQEAGDPATADLLREAAQAIRDGDIATAQARLGEAGQASAQAATEAGAQAAAGEAAQAAAAAGERLQQARDGKPGSGQADGSGSGEGQGEGEGQGDGQGDGQGQGQGQGSGDGQGQGQGAGGNPSGNVNGGGGSAGQGGQGGQGTGTGHTDGSGGPDTDTIFDPAHGTGGETGSVGGGSGNGQGGTIGSSDGQTNNGSANVPVSDVIDDYTQQATDAMNNPAVPPSIRALVLAYFNQLQGKN